MECCRTLLALLMPRQENVYMTIWSWPGVGNLLALAGRIPASALQLGRLVLDALI